MVVIDRKVAFGHGACLSSTVVMLVPHHRIFVLSLLFGARSSEIEKIFLLRSRMLTIFLLAASLGTGRVLLSHSQAVQTSIEIRYTLTVQEGLDLRSFIIARAVHLVHIDGDFRRSHLLLVPSLTQLLG